MYTLACEVVRALRGYRCDGVTVIVHDADLRPGAIRVAVASTLGSRAEQRAVFAEALARSVLADAGPAIDPEALARLAVRDYETAGGKR
jgi:hypothetical protein